MKQEDHGINGSNGLSGINVHVRERKVAEENNYEKLLKQYPCTLIAQQQGSFYRTYGDAAYILHGLIGFKLNISEDGVVHAGFPIEHPERALMAIKDNKISFKFFHGDEIVDEKDFGDENQYAQMVLEYSGKDTPVKEKKEKQEKIQYTVPGEERPRQHASIVEGIGEDDLSAMNDLLASIEKKILKKGLRVEALTTVEEHRNGVVKITGIAIHT